MLSTPLKNMIVKNGNHFPIHFAGGKHLFLFLRTPKKPRKIYIQLINQLLHLITRKVSSSAQVTKANRAETLASNDRWFGNKAAWLPGITEWMWSTWSTGGAPHPKW